MVQRIDIFKNFEEIIFLKKIYGKQSMKISSKLITPIVAYFDSIDAIQQAYFWALVDYHLGDGLTDTKTTLGDRLGRDDYPLQYKNILTAKEEEKIEQDFLYFYEDNVLKNKYCL